MRKFYIALFSGLLFSTLNTGVNAQTVGTYVFSPSSGTYTPLSGTTASTAAGDDGTQGGIPIGFNFTYAGTVCTHVAVTTNGFIRLGTSAAVAIIAGLPNYDNSNFGASTNQPLIAPLWDDNNATGGSIVYVTSGSAPNRTFSVEWINMHMGGGGSTATPTGTFQVTLSETSNVITVVYGTVNAFTLSTASIGLNDATSFLSVTPGAPATASFATVNNTITSSANLTSGTTYTFSPPPPCVPGSLAGGTTQGPAAVCPSVNFNLSVSGGSFGTGLTYLWQSSPDGSSWVTAAGVATNQAYTGNITTNTYFRRRMTCISTDAFSTSLLVTMNTPTNCYCVSNSTNTTFESIGGVVVTGGINNVGTGATPYSNYTATQISTLYQGQSATATITKGAGAWFAEDMGYVFIDYNQDGDFTDAGELVGNGAGVTSPYVVNFTIPPTATVGTTRMRIKFGDGTFGTPNTNNPCGVYTYGEVEDYGIIITLPPPCTPPSGLTVTSLGPTTAGLSWTASTSNPSNGYQWEVRTSGAAGSGATGLTTFGSTIAGVTAAAAGGLSPNTNYSYYVRSNCGGIFSAWTSAFVFTTPCNPIATPFTETFATYATTFPPTCWTRNNATYLIGNAATAYGVGLGSAKFDFYNASAGTNLDLVTPLFTPVPAGWRCTFDHAYATFVFGEVDQLQISYSTDGGSSYSPLITYLGGTAGPLNTGGAILPGFTPSATQWIDKAVDLPVGTNRLRFRGVSAFGNNLYVDNIRVELTPSCLPVTNVAAQPVSPNSVIISFTPPATTPTVGYIVEYGPVGFTPGIDNNPGAGGTIGGGPGSPVTITGLTPSTTYDFYVRKVCIAGVDFSINKKATATTLCPAVNIPYVQNFESAVVPAMPTCTSKQDVNGNSGSFWLGTGGGSWETYTDANPLTYVSPSKALLYFYDFNNLARGGDDWFYAQGLNLTAGTNYRLKFFYKALDGVNFPEKMEVKFGTRAYAADMTGSLFVNNNINSVYGNTTFDSVRVDFTPPSTGVYYIGFHAMSNGDEFGILVDDISVKPSPLVDVGVSGITLPSLNCPTSGVFVQATVTNYNTTTQNFATYPVTVTANITGAGTGTLTTLLNTGTLAAGASMTVYLSPAFNFSSGGAYNITVTTSTNPATNDPETGNDSYSRLIVVNPNPPTPVITPAAPAICIGTPLLVSTQFIPPPAPVILPVFSSGAISIVVPDGSAAGATHTIPVTGIPANANIIEMSVTLNMTHTWAGDMIFNLKAPNGNILNLDKYIGGTDAAGFNFVGTVISSASGLNPLSSASAPRTGTFRPDAINTAVAVSGIQNPNGYVSNAASFADLYSVPNGSWTLAMADGVGFDFGTLTSWTITITYQILTPTITWTPVTGLYTNAGATTAYTSGSNAYSVYANPAATTTYTVTATTIAGCTASANTTVTVSPYPVVTIGSIPDTVCISDPLIPLSGSPVGGSWSGIGVSGNNFIPPATAVGTYTLTYSYTNAFGCTATATKKIAVKDCPERLILLRDNAVLLYPNPNNGQFNIRINSVLYNNLVMKVYNNNGILVRTQQLTGLAWGRVVPINLTNLSGGVYMVKFYYDGGVRTAEKTFKVIIGHE